MTAAGTLVAALTGLAAVAGTGGATPSPSPGGGFEAWEVSPGLIGFIPVFLIALACVGLFLSLTKQMRRVAVRQAQQDADDAAAAQAGGVPSGPTPAGGAGAGPGAPSAPTTARTPRGPRGTGPSGAPGPARRSGRGDAAGPGDGTAERR